MSSKVEQQASSLDTIKLILSLVLLLAGVVGFYYFSTWQGQPVSTLYRVLVLLLVVGVAAFVAFNTAQGRRLLGFMKDARIEVRKMVWPTRNETMQTTLMVFVIVFILSIFLWLVDMLLGWGIRTLLGGG